MMTKPPCKVGGIDCAKRCVGCRNNCKAWHEWLDRHNAELEQRRKAKDRLDDIDQFEGNRFLREKRNSRRIMDKKRRQRNG